MSFIQPSTHNDLAVPDATFKLIEVNANFSSVNPRAHCVLACYPNQANKDADTNALYSEIWDLREMEQTDTETGVVIAPAFDAIFGVDGDGTALDPRRQMYLFIRSLPKYADAEDLLP